MAYLTPWQVTIMGESAGATSIGIHLSGSRIQGLVHGAVSKLALIGEPRVSDIMLFLDPRIAPIDPNIRLGEERGRLGVLGQRHSWLFI